MAAPWPYWLGILTLMYASVRSGVSDGNHIEDRDIIKETSKSNNNFYETPFH